jgi:hypothetical protein
VHDLRVAHGIAAARQEAAIGEATAVIDHAAGILPRFDELSEQVADVLESKGFKRTGNDHVDLLNAYNTVMERIQSGAKNEGSDTRAAVARAIRSVSEQRAASQPRDTSGQFTSGKSNSRALNKAQLSVSGSPSSGMTSGPGPAPSSARDALNQQFSLIGR